MVPRSSLFQWTSHPGRAASRSSSAARLTDLLASVSNFGATARSVSAVKSANTPSANSWSWAQYTTTRLSASRQPAASTNAATHSPALRIVRPPLGYDTRSPSPTNRFPRRPVVKAQLWVESHQPVPLVPPVDAQDRAGDVIYIGHRIESGPRGGSSTARVGAGRHRRAVRLPDVGRVFLGRRPGLLGEPGPPAAGGRVGPGPVHQRLTAGLSRSPREGNVALARERGAEGNDPDTPCTPRPTRVTSRARGPDCSAVPSFDSPRGFTDETLVDPHAGGGRRPGRERHVRGVGPGRRAQAGLGRLPVQDGQVRLGPRPGVEHGGTGRTGRGPGDRREAVFGRGRGDRGPRPDARPPGGRSGTTWTTRSR